MLRDRPLISIIALNWNTTAITCDFLKSIRQQNRYSNIEVIVVDNASNEDPTLPSCKSTRRLSLCEIPVILVFGR